MTVAAPERDAVRASDESRPLRILYSFPDTLGEPGIGVAARHHTEQLALLGHEVACTAPRSRARPRGGRPPARQEALTLAAASGSPIAHSGGSAPTATTTARRPGARPPAGQVDIVHLWPRATWQHGRREAHGPRGPMREAPNTHTAFAYERVAEENAKLGLGAVAGHSHEGGDGCSSTWRSASTRRRTWWPSFRRTSGQTFLDHSVDEERLGMHRTGSTPGGSPSPPPRPVDVGEGLRAIFVGRCEPRKGLHYALEAWIESGAAERGTFTICGDFYPATTARSSAGSRIRASGQGLGRRRRGAHARERRVRVSVDRGRERARDVRGPGVRLRARRLGRGGRPLRAYEPCLVHEAGDVRPSRPTFASSTAIAASSPGCGRVPLRAEIN